MIPKIIIHLLSGGLDSVTMLYDLKAQGHSIHCLLFNYGQAHKQELDCAQYHCVKLHIGYTLMEIPELGGLSEESWIVPNRNAIFLSHAVNLAAKASADTITIGCNADDAGYFPDCRMEFIEAMNRATRLAGYDVEICAPYISKKKWQIGDLARQMGVKLIEIWTCYQPTATGEACGKCPACLKLAAIK
jgi:7-cyano-7-deazaguanine synthase